MKKKICAMAGVVLAFGVFVTGCSSKAEVPVESTQVETVMETEDPFSLGGKEIAIEETQAPTVAVIGEEEGTQIGVTAEGETQYHFDKYGPLGKEVWEEIAYQWTSYALNTEDELRIIMDATYGNMSTKEELTQDILALPRNEHNEGLSAQSQPQAQAQAQESKPSTQAPKPTQPQETKPAPQQPQQSQQQQPQQQPQEQAPQQTPPQQNHGLIPGTNLPSTGNPETDQLIKEQFQRQEEMVSGQTTPGDYSNTTIDQGAGLNWN